MTVDYYGFQWDDKKNKLNFKKHGIHFEDPFILEKLDTKHSTDEEICYQYIGMIRGILALFVIAADRDEK